MDTSDPLLYRLVYELLSISLSYEKKFRSEIIEFLKWIRVVSSCYHLNELDEYYNDNLDQINVEVRTLNLISFFTCLFNPVKH